MNGPRPADRLGNAPMEMVLFLPLLVVMLAGMVTVTQVAVTDSTAATAARHVAFQARSTPYDDGPLFTAGTTGVGLLAIDDILGPRSSVEADGGLILSGVELPVVPMFDRFKNRLPAGRSLCGVVGDTWDHQTVRFQRHARLTLGEKVNYFGGGSIGNLGAFGRFIGLGGGGDSSANVEPVGGETDGRGGFVKGLKDRGGEVWQDLKGVWELYRDSQGWGDEPGDFRDAWVKIGRGGIAFGKLSLSSAISTNATLAGLNTPFSPYKPKFVQAANDHLKGVGIAVANEAWKGYVDAYEEGGWKQAAGRGTVDVAKLFFEVLLTKGAGSALKATKVASKIDLIDAKARRHILEGDGPGKGGGHRFGTGKPGKSEFPADWSDDRILETVSDIAKDPNVEWSLPDSRGYIVGKRTVDGVDVKVVVDTVSDRIVTAYPSNLPKNP